MNDKYNFNLSFKSPKESALKAQTTMVLMMIVILLFVGTVIMLLTFANTVKQTDYINLYAHNLLLSVMRSDTGYTDQECKLVSDVLACAFFDPTRICGSGGPTCLELANRTANDLINKFSMVKKSYSYLLVVEPIGYNAMINGEPLKIIIGDQSVATSKSTKYTANEEMKKTLSSGIYTLNARLTIMTKPD